MPKVVGGGHSTSTSSEGFNQENVDFTAAVVGTLTTVFGGASHYSDFTKAAGKVGVVGNIVSGLSYGNALWTHQAKPSHHLDAAITGTILGLTLFPGTTWIGIPAGFIYGGLRIVFGAAIDQELNNHYAPSPVLTPNKFKP